MRSPHSVLVSGDMPRPIAVDSMTDEARLRWDVPLLFSSWIPCRPGLRYSSNCWSWRWHRGAAGSVHPVDPETLNSFLNLTGLDWALLRRRRLKLSSKMSRSWCTRLPYTTSLVHKIAEHWAQPSAALIACASELKLKLTPLRKQWSRDKSRSFYISTKKQLEHQFSLPKYRPRKSQVSRSG